MKKYVNPQITYILTPCEDILNSSSNPTFFDILTDGGENGTGKLNFGWGQ